MAVIYYSAYEKSMDSHALLKEALKDYCHVNHLPIKADEIVIIKDKEHGKPYLRGIDHVSFSISHSGKWWTCAIANKAVGLDLQEIPNKQNNVGRLAERFYHEREIEWLKEKDDTEFYRLWAYKESYVKYTGVGLLKGLDYFSVVRKDRTTLGVEDVYQKEIVFFDEHYYLVLTFEEVCDIKIKELDKQLN